MIVDDNLYSEKEKSLITDVVYGENLQWSFINRIGRKDDRPYMAHMLWAREDQTHYSHLCGFFMKKLKQFCTNNNIKLNHVIRGAINIGFPLGKHHKDFWPPHIDYDNPHKVLISYLNDTNGGTIVYKEDKETVKHEFEPKAFRTICFEGEPHAPIWTDKGPRIILVINFD